jgi:hypothetical protein
LSRPSNGSAVRCRKLAFSRRLGGVGTMRVHRLGANAKPWHSGVGIVALINQSCIVKSVWHPEEWEGIASRS